MTGGMSMLLLSLGWIFENRIVELWTGAYVFGLIAATIVADENRVLRRALIPKLFIECDPQDVRCKVAATHLGHPCNYLRMIVTNKSATALDHGRAYLEGIEKNGQVLMAHDSRRLTFAPGHEPDACDKVLEEDVDKMLDVLMVDSRNFVFVCTPTRELIRLHGGGLVFAAHGEYFLRIVVVARGTSPKRVNLRFTWTGNWQTAELAY